MHLPYVHLSNVVHCCNCMATERLVDGYLAEFRHKKCVDILSLVICLSVCSDTVMFT